MPRHKEFDPDKALNDAMHLFWEKGYEATSVQDLVDRMGINRFSMYDTFGGKHELFLATLDRYKKELGDDILGTMENSEDGLDSIRAYFTCVVGHLSSSAGKHACLMINSIMEMGVQDKKVASSCAANTKRLNRAFTSALKRAQLSGEIDAGRDIKEIAEFLVNGVMGLNVMAKQGSKKSTFKSNVDLMLSVIS